METTYTIEYRFSGGAWTHPELTEEDATYDTLRDAVIAIDELKRGGLRDVEWSLRWSDGRRTPV